MAQSNCDGALVEAIHAAVAAHAGEPALVDEDGGARTYEQVWAAAAGGARRLRRALLDGDGACVGLVADEGPRLVLAMLCCWRAGVPFVPLDRTWPAARRAEVMGQLGVETVIVAGDDARLFDDNPVTIVSCDELLSGDGGGADADAECGSRNSNGDEGAAPAYFISTSGSTGKAKLVETGQAQVLEAARAKAEAEDIGAGCRVFLASHFTFDPCQVDVAAALVSGAAVVAPARASATSWRLAGVLQACRATHVCCTPTHWKLVDATPEDLPQLRCVSLGGEAFPRHLLATWCRSHVVFRNTYGLTEGTGYQSSAVVDGSGGDVHVGRGFGRYTLAVEEGEIVVRGPGLSRYHGEPAVEALRTGDLGREEAGGIVVLGRRDGIVKVRGQRLALEEVDAVLMRCDIVGNAVACMVDGAVGACVQVTRSLGRVPLPVLTTAVEAHCRSQLPPYAVPSKIGILMSRRDTRAKPSKHTLDSGSGKADRESAAALVKKQHDRVVSEQEVVAPATAVERLVAQSWQAVLGVGACGRLHNFAHLGGDSISALRVCNRVRQSSTLREPERFGPITAPTDVASMLVTAEAPEGSLCELRDIMGPFAPCELIARPVLQDYAVFLEQSGVVPQEEAGGGPTDGCAAKEASAVYQTAMYCCKHSHEDLLRCLVDSDEAWSADDGPWGLLHEAAASACEAVVELLLDAGVVVRPGVAAVAAARGKVGVLRLLLASGAEASALDENGQSILHLAARSGDMETVVAALESVEAALHDLKDAEGTSALGWAVQNGHMEVARFLGGSGCAATSALEEAALVEPVEEESFGRVQRKKRAQHVETVAHRKVEREDERLVSVLGVLRGGSEADVLEAVGAVRLMCCAVKAHRLKFVEMGVLDDLKGLLWPAGRLASQAAGAVRNLAHEAATRERMLREGVVACVARLLNETPPSEESFWRAAGALASISASKSTWPVIVSTGALARIRAIDQAKRQVTSFDAIALDADGVPL